MPAWSADEQERHCPSGEDEAERRLKVSRSGRRDDLCAAVRNGSAGAVHWTCGALPPKHWRAWHTLFRNYTQSCICSFTARLKGCAPSASAVIHSGGAGPGSCAVFDETPRYLRSDWWVG